MNSLKKNTKQLSIFITAGYPEIDSLPLQLESLELNGVDFVEVGIPFSDPLADGPTIQKTSKIALRNGMNLDVLFNQLSHRSTSIPVVLMGYLNPIISFGISRFLEACNRVNVQSVILPDMSLEIYNRFYRDSFELHGVYPVFLITPRTPDERILLIAENCSNSFVYLVSTNTTTGSASHFDQIQQERFRKIKELCGETPVFIGFGIDNREKVNLVNTVADGAIIGSAYLNALSNNGSVEFLESLKLTHV